MQRYREIQRRQEERGMETVGKRRVEKRDREGKSTQKMGGKRARESAGWIRGKRDGENTEEKKRDERDEREIIKR